MFRPRRPLANLHQASLPNLCVLCALRVEIPILPLCSVSQERALVSPFPATLTDHSQLIENALTLSPVFVTLTNIVNHKPFVCHSCKKHRGWGIPSLFSPLSPLVIHQSPLSPVESALTQNAPITRLESALPKTQDLKPFRIRTYEKTGGGATHSSP